MANASVYILQTSATTARLCTLVTMSDYEILRAKRIARNKALIQELKLDDAKSSVSPIPMPSDGRPQKRRKVVKPTPRQPMRASARLASMAGPQPSYNEEDSTPRERKERKQPTPSRPAEPSGPLQQSSFDITRLETQWASWKPTAGPPTRDSIGTFHFPSSDPTFSPNKSPSEMLREGVFGGSYFRPLYSSTLRATIADDWRELPSSWTDGLDVGRSLTNLVYDSAVNKYGVACGQSIEAWEAAGWIRHEFDVRGWFQWYCRFFMGRRCDDDERQIGRWRRCVGESGRWRRALLAKYGRAGIRDVNDEGMDAGEGLSPAVHQTCLHWAWELRQDVLDRWWSGEGA